MAQEGSEASVASSSPTPNWWEIHANPLSWSNMNRFHPQNPHSNSSCDEDFSISTTTFTNASNTSGLSVDSSSADLSGEPMENHLWSQVLLGVGSSGDLHSSHGNGENFLEVLSSKSLTTEMFDPACDYLKKLDSSWEFTNPTSFNSLEKQLNNYSGDLMEHERLTNLSDLVSNWSIAPPNPQLDHQIAPSSCNVSLNHLAQYSTSNTSQIKHELPNSSSCMGNGFVVDRSSSYFPYYGHEIKEERKHLELGASDQSFLRSFSSNGMGYQTDLNSSVLTGLNNKNSSAMTDVPWSNTRNLSDLISFGSYLNKPSMEFRSSKHCAKGSDPSDMSKKQGHETSSSTRGNGRGTGTTSEGKKKRSEDNSEPGLKKSKLESPTVSSLKLQAPKVKVGERITTLQQIVSPFGKTDTASVLLEAIKTIRFLQGQVQLLCDPYMKSNADKDHNSWGVLERKDKLEPKLDLKGRGLCLVPISCTPEIYRENTGPDYWTATYRGCLYR